MHQLEEDLSSGREPPLALLIPPFPAGSGWGLCHPPSV